MLPTLPFPADRITHFTGRTWLLPPLLAWLERPVEPVFLVTGGPGSGMTMLVHWLAATGGRDLWPAPGRPQDASQLEDLRSRVAAAYFCSSARHNLSPRQVAESLANQLVRHIPEFAAALTATLAERVRISATLSAGTITGGEVSPVRIDYLDLGAWDDEASFSAAFYQPIQQLYASGYTKPILILIDALDEAYSYTGRISLVHLLSRLEDLPGPVRFLVTTRPDPRLLRFFRTAPSLDLVSDAPDGPAEVSTYVSHRLAAQLPSLDSAACQQLAARISAQAQGVFLAARLLLDDLLAHPERLAADDLLAHPEPLASAPHLPGLQKLGDFYYDFLNRELGRDESLWFATYRPLLGLIAVSRGFGFTRLQLAALLDQDVDQPLRVCKQMLAGDLPDGPFRFFDRSFSDFLLTDPHNLDFHIPAGEMHRKITDYYLQTYRQDWMECDSYGLYHLVAHTLACPMNTAERKEVFASLLSDSFVHAVQEQTGWLFAFIESLEVQASTEPLWTARQCITLILDRTPNSLVIQHALHLLVRLRPHTGRIAGPGNPRQARLADLVDLLADPPPDLETRLLSALAAETNARVRGAIALGAAEAGAQAGAETGPAVSAAALVAPLLDLFWQSGGTLSWAAADALVTLNHRPLIPELIAGYQALQPKNDSASRACKERLLYILGRMHAAEALVLKPGALAAHDPRIIGRAVDFMTFLPPEDGDEAYLRQRLADILASDPLQPASLGPWADEWLQKRLVRNLVKLHFPGLTPAFRHLQEHIQQRPAPVENQRLPQPWRRKSATRKRLTQAVSEGLTELQTGR